MSTQRAAALCFALFVFAGYYKAADLLRFVPFDLTLAFWLTTAGFCLHALWRQRRLPAGTLAILLIFATMALGLHWPGADLGEIGRASWRERVCQLVQIQGVAGSLKKKKKC